MSMLKRILTHSAWRQCAIHGSLLLVLLLLWPTAATAYKGVLSTLLESRAASPPKITVLQEVNALGQLRYTRIAEDIMHYPIVVLGDCNANYRVEEAYVETCYQDLDGTVSSLEGCGASTMGSTHFHHDFDVNTHAKDFGVHEETLEVPTTFLVDILTSAGEELVQEKSEEIHKPAANVRLADITEEVDWPLTFYMGCRRWAFGNAVAYQTSYALLPLDVTFRGAAPPGGPFEIKPVPPHQPNVPIPFNELTDIIHIEQAQLFILPSADPDVCGFHLSGVFVTSGPTRVTYRLVDALGARSPVFEVDVDQTNTAFFSHDINFAPGTGETLGLSLLPGQPPNPAGGVAFAGSFVDVPSDRLHGYYRVETVEPHHATSNIVSYNLEDCTGSAGPRSLSFDAAVIGEWNSVLEAFRSAREPYKPAK
jgi:hypothetical protein